MVSGTATADTKGGPHVKGPLLSGLGAGATNYEAVAKALAERLGIADWKDITSSQLQKEVDAQREVARIARGRNDTFGERTAIDTEISLLRAAEDIPSIPMEDRQVFYKEMGALYGPRDQLSNTEAAIFHSTT